MSRTWFDLASRCLYYDHVALTDAILHRRLSTPEQLAFAIKAGRRGVKIARLSLLAADERAESPWETRTRMMLHAVGIMVTPQVVVRDVLGNVIARVDLALPEFKIAIEYDGEHHLGIAQQRADVDRARALERAGWLVLRFGVEDVRDNPRRMIAEIRAAITRRRSW
ncbi:hypothetical protein GCM10009765_46090 [Fodinicola feengrottensis]|uniref:DUF559 domain-containing protein n=1 Tax=Fodinicola feengrottensis TaxID=435914 RepID=A0ABN2HPX1_9ACTN